MNFRDFYNDQYLMAMGRMERDFHSVDIDYETGALKFFAVSREYQTHAFTGDQREDYVEYEYHLHRNDGPAIINQTGEVEFYIKGEKMCSIDDFRKGFGNNYPVEVIYEFAGEDLQKFKKLFTESFYRPEETQQQFEIEL